MVKVEPSPSNELTSTVPPWFRDPTTSVLHDENNLICFDSCAHCYGVIPRAVLDRVLDQVHEGGQQLVMVSGDACFLIRHHRRNLDALCLGCHGCPIERFVDQSMHAHYLVVGLFS